MEIGADSTPRNGAGLIATDAAARPRPARIWANSPPNEWPTTTGFRPSRALTASRWDASRSTRLPAKTAGRSLASATVS